MRLMNDAVLYIHGQGGSGSEYEHYRPLFPGYDLMGLDYRTATPWEAGAEIRAVVERLHASHEKIVLIANSIGAYFSMSAEVDRLISKAWFISPIIDLEKLVIEMMQWANVTEDELKEKGRIHTSFGADLSWEYLCYVRSHPIRWDVPTQILYGGRDHITSLETMRRFVKKHNATLTVMEHGEHWFHTADQMRFLDDWIKSHEGGNT